MLKFKKKCKIYFGEREREREREREKMITNYTSRIHFEIERIRNLKTTQNKDLPEIKRPIKMKIPVIFLNLKFTN